MKRNITVLENKASDSVNDKYYVEGVVYGLCIFSEEVCWWWVGVLSDIQGGTQLKLNTGMRHLTTVTNYI